MKIYTSYSVKIKGYNNIFKETIAIYRNAVDYFIELCLKEWESLREIKGSKAQMREVEILCHRTKDNPDVRYSDFDNKFYKLPSYLRRGAIIEAIGKVSSYKSNLTNWEEKPVQERGKKPSEPEAGYVYPCLYKSDIDYIERHCKDRKKCVPTLQKRGKEYFLDFSFEETVKLTDTEVSKQTIVSVDLGLNNAAVISIMIADGTIIGRHFLKLPEEYDCLDHSINRIKKAQQNGNKKTPRLWAKAKGINKDISVKTAKFIMEAANYYGAEAEQ